MVMWKEFLDSLASRGGSIFMLLTCSVLCGIAAIHWPASSLDTTFAGFTGALLMALTTTSKASTGTDTTVVSASSAEPKVVPKTEQVPSGDGNASK